MENCLVTKLKGIVDNDNLPKIGEFKFTVDVKEGILAPLFFESTERFTATIEGEGHFYKGTPDSQTDVTTTISNVLTTGGYRISAGVSVIKVTPKYNLTNVSLNGAPASTNPYNSVSIDLEQLYYNKTGIGKLQLGTNDIDLAIEVDVDKLKFNNLSVLSVSSSKLKGHIVNIAKAAGDGNLTVGCLRSGITTQLIGTVEEYIRNVQPAHYGHSDTIRSDAAITLNGSVFTGTSMLVAFDSEGNATITRAVDSTVAATYNRSNDTFTYNL